MGGMSLSAEGAACITGGVLLLIVAGALGLLQARRAQQALRRQRFQLDTALNMSHGLCMFDAAKMLPL